MGGAVLTDTSVWMGSAKSCLSRMWRRGRRLRRRRKVRLQPLQQRIRAPQRTQTDNHPATMHMTDPSLISRERSSPTTDPSDTLESPSYGNGNGTPGAVRLGVAIGLTLFFLALLGTLVFIVWRRRRAAGWNLGPRRKSQHRFDKAELDASSCEVSMPARAKHGWEMDATRTPRELPATPLTINRWRFGGKAELP